ncbi:hypothetical protein C5167_013756 [Papaver somniferum]|uniref:Uncharacterized protein n=1 Tax=Papaver somniferum TaxID=3469 RepID=A0A4Y7J277_PAPSO|nr:uncharacterized protein LOC113359747 [Papaver somniferum]RZC54897.1 hypothetical protein C5167_013756 [Papaver somniferum]
MIIFWFIRRRKVCISWMIHAQKIMEVIELLEKEIELNESSSDYTKANTACDGANGADVVRYGVGSGLENGAGKVAGHSQERGLVSAEVVGDGVVSELDNSQDYGAVKAAGHTQEAPEAEVETGLTTSKVNEVCKVVEVLKNESSGSDTDWKTERITASPSEKTDGSSSKTTSARKRKDESGDYESDFKRGRSET